jgi:hypothetical protein
MHFRGSDLVATGDPQKPSLYAVECSQFREYAAMLGHNLPSRGALSSTHLQNMFLRHYSEMLSQLLTVNDLTMGGQMHLETPFMHTLARHERMSLF